MHLNVRFFGSGSFAGVVSWDPLCSSSRSPCPNPVHEFRNKQNGFIINYLVVNTSTYVVEKYSLGFCMCSIQFVAVLKYDFRNR